MANKLVYPLINPLQMFLPDLTRDDRFNSQTFEDFDFPDTILPWEQNVGFKQPWQLNDTIPLQLQSNIGPVNFVLKDCATDAVIDTIQLDQMQENENDPGMFIYELSTPLSIYDPGDYYAELQFGPDPVVFTIRTGILNFEELQDNTLLLEYDHTEFREDVIFETGWRGNVRVHGWNKFLGPKQKVTAYEDQVLDMSVLRAQKYRLWELRIGGTPAKGIPDYFADMIGGIIGCDGFSIDGKRYAADTGKDLEPVELENYPMRGWGIELRERFTKASTTFENDVPVGGQLTAMVTVGMKGFGNSTTGSQTAVINVT